jgi:hypothetical protein
VLLGRRSAFLVQALLLYFFSSELDPQWDLLGYIQNLMTGKAKSLSPNPSTKSLVLSFKNKGPTEDPTP